MAGDFVRVNGKAFDHSSVVMKIAGRRITQAKDIKYDEKRNRSKVVGMNRAQTPVAVTRGNYEAGQLTITTTHAEAAAVRKHLASKSRSGTSFGDALVPGTCQYIEPGLEPVVDAFKNLRLTSRAGGTTQGPDPLYTDLVFDFDSMKSNGLTLYSGD